jgi:hypothetical protein
VGAQQEEKRSDVALGAKMVADCCEGRFDVAVLVSDDTDMAPPVEMVRERGRRVIVVSPRGYWLRDLAPDQADVRKIHAGVIESHQLPDPVVLDDGTVIAKPRTLALSFPRKQRGRLSAAREP